MSFFYLEYAALALVVVYFARKITLDEMKRGGEFGDRSDAEIKKGQLKP